MMIGLGTKDPNWFLDSVLGPEEPSPFVAAYPDSITLRGTVATSRVCAPSSSGCWPCAGAG